MVHTDQHPHSSEFCPVYAYAQSIDSTCWYFLADVDASQGLKLHPQPSLGAIVPVRSTRIDRFGTVSFFSPMGGAFLCAGEVDASKNIGPLALAATLPRGYEKFSLEPVHPSRIPEKIKDIASILDAFGRPDCNVDDLASFIFANSGHHAAAEAVNAAGMFLSSCDLRHLASILLAEPDIAASQLKAIFKSDIYAIDAIPSLFAWLTRTPKKSVAIVPRRDVSAEAHAAEREAGQTDHVELHTKDHALNSFVSAPVRHIGISYDRLDSEGIDGNYVSLPLALNIQLRRLVEPTKRCCLVATARDEGIYILEWVAHHKALGFDHIFLYSNDNVDGSDHLLQALHQAGIITWVQSTVGAGRRAQWKAYGHALRIMPDTLDYEWSLLIDLDEFFNPSPMFGSVVDFLNWHETRTVDAIGINWLMVGSNGETYWRDEGLAKRFPFAIAGANQHIKSLFRTRKFIHSYAHDPATLKDEPISFRNAIGRNHEFDPALSRGIALNPDITTASIVHFYFKSNEEYVWKAARNRGAHLRSQGTEFSGWDISGLKSHVSSSNHVQVETGLSNVSARVEREMNELLSDPTIRRGVEHVKAVYKERIQSLIQIAAGHHVVASAGEAGKAFMKPLLEKFAP